MVDLLKKTLAVLGLPVKKQGSFKPKQSYPDHFFTFWNDSADGTSYYSNTEGAIVWQYSLNAYSIDPQRTNSMLLEAKKLLNAEGWIVSGAGYDVMSDEPTHTGRGITITYRQQQ